MTTSRISSTLQKQSRSFRYSVNIFLLLPFIVGLFDGVSPMQVWINENGRSKFIQGLAIEIFILALYALSYDLIFGFTGLLSFGHSMFFAVGAYLTGILLKNFGFSLGATFGLILVAGVVQALLFGVVLPRVKRDHLCTGHTRHGIGLQCAGTFQRIGRIHWLGCGFAGCCPRMGQPGYPSPDACTSFLWRYWP